MAFLYPALLGVLAATCSDSSRVSRDKQPRMRRNVGTACGYQALTINPPSKSTLWSFSNSAATTVARMAR
jgi:hypothetical protein